MAQETLGTMSLGLRVLLPGALNALAERTRGGRHAEAAQRLFNAVNPDLKRADLVRLGDVLEELAKLCRAEGHRRTLEGEP